MEMNRTLLEFDVTADLPVDLTKGQRASVAMWIFLPPKLDELPTVSSWLNGGTYDKRYFDVQVPGRSGYSMAEHLANAGHVVLLCDHLGIGDSSKLPDPHRVDRHVAARANHAALQKAYARLEAGTLHPGLPPLPRFVRLGGGHSMGGMQTITQQARHKTWDRIAVLGFTAIGVHLMVNGQHVSAHPGELDYSKPPYWRADRSFLRTSFHWDDVPEDVLRADDDLLVDVPYVLSTQSITAGIVTEDARNIDVPVYICLGERDVSPDPHAEPAMYASSPDITLQILPRSGHCQSFAGTRQEMYERIVKWNDSLPHGSAS